jgi:hypothetical protein
MELTMLNRSFGKTIFHYARSITFIAVAAVTFSSHLRAEDFKAGAAKRIITPDPLLPVSGGLGPTAPAREKQGDLTARAVVFQKGDTSIAIVGLDLLGFPSVLADRVRAKVTRIPAKNIMIGSYAQCA